MKVLHIEAGRYLYGGAQQVAWLVDGLSRQGVDNVLVCPSGSSIANECRSACKVLEIPMGGDLDIAQIWRLSRLFAAEKPDLVHIHSRRGADVFGGLAAKLAGVPCVLSRRVDNRESRFMAPWKYSLYARVIVISDAIGEVLRSCGVKEGLIRSVRSAVDHQQYRVAADPDWFHREFGLPGDAIVLAMIAQLIPRKGHQYFLSILPDLLVRYPNFHVLIFGQGPLASELDKQIASEALSGRVTMAGFRDDLERVLPNLYAVIHPAEREGLGVALLQSSAAGVPVVAAAAGGIPEIIRHEENGLIVEVGDVDGLSRSIESLLLSSDYRNALGEAGQQMAEEEFSIDAMVAGNLSVYREIVAN